MGAGRSCDSCAGFRERPSMPSLGLPFSKSKYSHALRLPYQYLRRTDYVQEVEQLMKEHGGASGSRVRFAMLVRGVPLRLEGHIRDYQHVEEFKVDLEFTSWDSLSLIELGRRKRPDVQELQFSARASQQKETPREPLPAPHQFRSHEEYLNYVHALLRANCPDLDELEVQLPPDPQAIAASLRQGYVGAGVMLELGEQLEGRPLIKGFIKEYPNHNSFLVEMFPMSMSTCTLIETVDRKWGEKPPLSSTLLEPEVFERRPDYIDYAEEIMEEHGGALRARVAFRNPRGVYVECSITSYKHTACFIGTSTADEELNLSLSMCTLIETADKKLRVADGPSQTLVSDELDPDQSDTAEYHGLDVDAALKLAEDLPHRMHLTKLRVQHGAIGDRGVQALAEAIPHCHALDRLDVRGNGITEVGAQHLAKVMAKGALKELELYHNFIGEAGARLLADKLPHSKLERLLLSGNGIGERGVRALAENLEEASSLKELNLDHNDIGEGGAQVLAKVLPRSYLEKLHVRGNGIGAEGSRALEMARRQTQGRLRIFGLTY